MATKIRFRDVQKTFTLPGIVALHYTGSTGAPMQAKVKALAHSLICPTCGKPTPVLTVTARGLCCRACTLKQKATGE